MHFPGTRSGLDKSQKDLDGYNVGQETFFGICEPIGGFFGATMFEYWLDKGHPTWLVEEVRTWHMRENSRAHIPKTDEIDARTMARIGYLHEAVREEFTLRPLSLAKSVDADLLALCHSSGD